MKRKCIVCLTEMPQTTTPGTPYLRRSSKRFRTCCSRCSKIYNRIVQDAWPRFLALHKPRKKK